MSERPFGLLELVERVGEDNVRVQPLLEAITNVRRLKRGDASVTFVTSQDFLNPNDLMVERVRHVGLVLWIPTELVEKARAERDAEADDATN